MKLRRDDLEICVRELEMDGDFCVCHVSPYWELASRRQRHQDLHVPAQERERERLLVYEIALDIDIYTPGGAQALPLVERDCGASDM